MEPNPKNFCGGNFHDWLEVNLINKCNGKCSWCIERRGYHPQYVASWQEMADAVIKTDRENIILLGGEPTLYKNMKELVFNLIQANRKVWITTNGGLITREYIQTNLKGITGINISIHHYDLGKNKEITGIDLKKETLFEAIEELKKNGVRIRFNCNCIERYIDNEKEILKYIEFAKSFNVLNVRFAELKYDNGSFVDLAKILNYKYGLNDNPYILGCNNEAVVNGVKIDFRQMCGLQTDKRPKPENPTMKYPKAVLYYDGKIYNGWQQIKEEAVMSQKQIEQLLTDVLKGKVSREKATKMLLSNMKYETKVTTNHCDY